MISEFPIHSQILKMSKHERTLNFHSIMLFQRTKNSEIATFPLMFSVFWKWIFRIHCGLHRVIVLSHPFVALCLWENFRYTLYSYYPSRNLGLWQRLHVCSNGCQGLSERRTFLKHKLLWFCSFDVICTIEIFVFSSISDLHCSCKSTHLIEVVWSTKISSCFCRVWL